MLYVGIFHIVLPILIIVYFVLAPTWLDFYAFLYIAFMSLHWIIFNGECVISYMYKKQKYNSYDIGENTELEDINDFLRYVEYNYGWSYQMTKSFVSWLNMFALSCIVARFILLDTVKPRWAIWVYIFTTFAWNQWFRRRYRLSIVDVIYAICLLVVISEVIIKHK